MVFSVEGGSIMLNIVLVYLGLGTKLFDFSLLTLLATVNSYLFSIQKMCLSFFFSFSSFKLYQLICHSTA